LATSLKKEEFLKKRERVLKELDRKIAKGVGHGSDLKLSDGELDGVLEKGGKWALDKGYAIKEDLKHTEDGGVSSWGGCF